MNEAGNECPYGYDDQPYVKLLAEQIKKNSDKNINCLVVLHDRWCGALNGSFCTCRPTVRPATNKERRLMMKGEAISEVFREPKH